MQLRWVKGLDNRGYQSVRIGKIFHYDNPSTIGTSGMDDIYSWDQTINPYGRDKKEEYKINTLSPRRYGGYPELALFRRSGY